MRLWEWAEKHRIDGGEWSCEETRALVGNDLPRSVVWEHTVVYRHKPSGRAFEEVFRLSIDHRTGSVNVEFLGGKELRDGGG